MPNLTADDWPIATAMLPFSQRPTSTPPTEQDAEQWSAALKEAAAAGFRDIDLTDVWVRPGDLAPHRLDELSAAADDAGVDLVAVSAIRCSVIDEESGAENLAYSHRTLDAAAALGISTVSFGLHQALTEQQQEQLWFWTVEGHKDPEGRPDLWRLAVDRLRDLGRHAASLGIVMSLEMYEDTYIGTADGAVRLVEDIDLDNVGLNPDLGNLIRPHRPVESWRTLVERTLPYTNYWHVKNYARDENRLRDFYSAVPTTMELGLIDYRWAFQYALQSGFQGIVCVEHYGGDGLGVSATNQAYLRDSVLPRRPDYPLGTSLRQQPPPVRRRAATPRDTAADGPA